MKYPKILMKIAEWNGEDLRKMKRKEVVTWADWLCFVIGSELDQYITNDEDGFTEDDFTELKKFVEKYTK